MYLHTKFNFLFSLLIFLYHVFVTVAPGRPKIYFEQKNKVEEDRPENYQQDSQNIVIDEGSPTVTLVCIVNGGKNSRKA